MSRTLSKTEIPIAEGGLLNPNYPEDKGLFISIYPYIDMDRYCYISICVYIYLHNYICIYIVT